MGRSLPNRGKSESEGCDVVVVVQRVGATIAEIWGETVSKREQDKR